MPKTKTKKYLKFHVRRHRVRVLLDKVLIFRYIRGLHGRFWGIAAVLGMITGFEICFLIRPDLFSVSTALSNFGNNVRTAPYFAGTVFFGAYGLWRWRNYLSRTLKRSMPITGLVTLTIFGLYLVALMPISWHPWPWRIHIFGISLAGVSMLLTVVLDGVLSKTKRTARRSFWRFLRFISFFSIIVGGWLTLGSVQGVEWYHLSLLGESLMLLGYALWITVKTYQGEGSRTTLSKMLKDVVLID
jgi:hypothetical protein